LVRVLAFFPFFPLKYLLAFLFPRFPWTRIVCVPVGLSKASWSKVIARPPAFSILALAVAENFNAQTLSFGSTRSRSSLTTVATTANKVLSFLKLVAIKIKLSKTNKKTTKCKNKNTIIIIMMIIIITKIKNKMKTSQLFLQIGFERIIFIVMVMVMAVIVVVAIISRFISCLICRFCSFFFFFAGISTF